MFRVLEFNPTRPVTPETALHDRIAVDMNGWRVIESAPLGDDLGALQNFANFLGAPPRGAASDQTALHGLLFNRPTGNQRSRITLECRKDRFRREHELRQLPPPLVRGKLIANVSRTSNQTGSLRQFSFLGNFHLNPTRLLRQFQPRYRRRLDLFPYDEIFEVRSSPYRDNEISLDHSTNWLFENDEGEVRASEQQTDPRWVAAHVHSVWSRIEYEIARASAVVNASNPLRLETVSAGFSSRISQVETYWEFFHPSPLRLVEGMKNAANRFVQTCEVTRYLEQTDRQSLSLRLQVRSGINLRIYAKTNRRVRFEVEHDLAKARNLARRRDFKNSVIGIRDFLMPLRIEAADVVNRFLNNLDSPFRVTSPQCTYSNLLLHIGSATRNFIQSRLLLDALSINHRYIVGENDPMAEAVRSLKRTGILLNRSGTRVYFLSSQWAQALDLGPSEPQNL